MSLKKLWLASLCLMFVTTTFADQKGKSDSRKSESRRESSRESSKKPDPSRPSKSEPSRPSNPAPKASNPAPAPKPSPAPKAAPSNPAPSNKAPAIKSAPDDRKPRDSTPEPRPKPSSPSRDDDRGSLRERMERLERERNERDSSPRGNTPSVGSGDKNPFRAPAASGNRVTNSVPSGKQGQAAANRDQDSPTASQQRFKSWLEQNQKSLPQPKPFVRATPKSEKEKPADKAVSPADNVGKLLTDKLQRPDRDNDQDRPNAASLKPLIGAATGNVPKLDLKSVPSAKIVDRRDNDHDHSDRPNDRDRVRLPSAVARPSLHYRSGHDHRDHHHHHHYRGGYYCGRPSWLVFSFVSLNAINRPAYRPIWIQPTPVVIPAPVVSGTPIATLPPPPARRMELTSDEFNDLPWPRQRELLGQALNSLGEDLTQADNGEVWREHLQLDVIATVLTEQEQSPDEAARARLRMVLDDFEELTQDESYRPITDLAGFRALFAGLAVVATEPLDRQHRRVVIAADNLSRAVGDWSTADQWRTYLRLSQLTGEDEVSIDIEQQLVAMTAILVKFDRVRIDEMFRVIREAPYFDATHVALRDYVMLLQRETQPEPPRPAIPN